LGGGADYYVSFDNVAVGTNIGEGLVKCMKENGDDSGPVALLNGSPTDNNATLFKQGLRDGDHDAGYEVVADQAVPDWTTRRPARSSSRCTPRSAASWSASQRRTTASAARWPLCSSATAHRAGPDDRTGRHGRGPPEGAAGSQCITVYKAVKKQADAAAELAIALTNGDTEAADALATGEVDDTETGEMVKSVLLEPQSIFKDNVQDVIADEFVAAEDVCTNAALKKACEEFGVGG
jgi:D-xylose transport system substrate-binding protein